MKSSLEHPLGLPTWRAYYELCKPRVVALLLLTCVVGMLLATPGWVPLPVFLGGLVGIGLTSAAGAVVNQLLDRDYDKAMSRTKHRPIPVGYISPAKALSFAMVLAVSGLGLLLAFTNTLTTILTFGAFIGYALIYTVYLKHATPQNIVIGGASGAMPPLLGWTAVTNQVDPFALLLFLIIFVWTPPHFWALAIHRYKEYQHANIPMLPVTHGIAYTKLNILLYTLLLAVITMLPWVLAMSGVIYALGALLLNMGFIYYAWRLKYYPRPLDAMATFRYSIWYLMGLFLFLLLDHYLRIG